MTHQAFYVEDKDNDVVNYIGEETFDTSAQLIADNDENGYELHQNPTTGNYYLSREGGAEIVTMRLNNGMANQKDVNGEPFTPPTVPVDPFA
jgi:hypothetical protein